MNDIPRLPLSLASMSVSEQLCISPSPSPKLDLPCHPNSSIDLILGSREKEQVFIDFDTDIDPCNALSAALVMSK